MIALLDGDEYLYKACYASQHSLYDVKRGDALLFTSKSKKDAVESLGNNNDPEITIEPRIEVEPLGVAIENLKASFNTTMSDTGAKDYRIFLSGRENFREALATIRPYKGHRVDKEKPYHYAALREHFIEEYFAEVVDFMEADDGMSIAQYEALRKGVTTIICSQDKDLKMVPGLHYNFYSSERKPFNIAPEEGTLFFYCQVLSGDLSVDNIEGIYGVAEKTARKILATVPQRALWGAVVDEYQKAIDSPKVYSKMTPSSLSAEERALEVARLVWMLEYPGQLWTPPI